MEAAKARFRAGRELLQERQGRPGRRGRAVAPSAGLTGPHPVLLCRGHHGRGDDGHSQGQGQWHLHGLWGLPHHGQHGVRPAPGSCAALCPLPYCHPRPVQVGVQTFHLRRGGGPGAPGAVPHFWSPGPCSDPAPIPDPGGPQTRALSWTPGGPGADGDRAGMGRAAPAEAARPGAGGPESPAGAAGRW